MVSGDNEDRAGARPPPQFQLMLVMEHRLGDAVP